MKAIIFTSVDSWNEEHKWAEICDDDAVEKTIEQAKRYCTEIVEYETINAYQS